MTRLEQLLAQWEEGTLTAEAVGELKELLATPEGRTALVDDWLLSEAIYGKLQAIRGTQTLEAEPQPVVESRAAEPDYGLDRQPGWLERVLPYFTGRGLPVWGRVAFGAAGAACLLLFGGWYYFQRTPAAAITGLDGSVSVQHGARNGPIQPGQGLYPGDIVRVPAGSTAVLAWSHEATRLRLGPNTELQVLGWARGRRFLLQRGTLQAGVAPQSRWRPLVLRTPQAMATVVGTWFSMEVTPAATSLEVTGGAVAFSKTHPTSASEKDSILVHAGQCAVASSSSDMKAGAITRCASREILAMPADAGSLAASSGTVLWSDLVTDLRIPAGSVRLPPTATARYGERVRCYLTPPATGEYTFWLHSGRPSELWLSTDDDPSHRQQIASVPRAAGARSGATPKPGTASWQVAPVTAAQSPSQKSSPQRLQGGVRYYLEVLAEHDAADVIRVSWAKPGEPANAPSSVVDRSVLSPYFETASVDGAAAKR